MDKMIVIDRYDLEQHLTGKRYFLLSEISSFSQNNHDKNGYLTLKGDEYSYFMKAETVNMLMNEYMALGLLPAPAAPPDLDAETKFDLRANAVFKTVRQVYEQGFMTIALKQNFVVEFWHGLTDHEVTLITPPFNGGAYYNLKLLGSHNNLNVTENTTLIVYPRIRNIPMPNADDLPPSERPDFPGYGNLPPAQPIAAGRSDLVMAVRRLFSLPDGTVKQKALHTFILEVLNGQEPLMTPPLEYVVNWFTDAETNKLDQNSLKDFVDSLIDNYLEYPPFSSELQKTFPSPMVLVMALEAIEVGHIGDLTPATIAGQALMDFNNGKKPKQSTNPKPLLDALQQIQSEPLSGARCAMIAGTALGYWNDMESAK